MLLGEHRRRALLRSWRRLHLVEPRRDTGLDAGRADQGEKDQLPHCISSSAAEVDQPRPRNASTSIESTARGGTATWRRMPGTQCVALSNVTGA